MTDAVNSPSHYKLNEHGVECIDAIRAQLNDDEFIGYLRGNIVKYLWRFRYKGKPLEDVRKAVWYLDKLQEVLGSSETEKVVDTILADKVVERIQDEVGTDRVNEERPKSVRSVDELLAEWRGNGARDLYPEFTTWLSGTLEPTNSATKTKTSRDGHTVELRPVFERVGDYAYDAEGNEYWIDPPSGTTIEEAEEHNWPIRYVGTGRKRAV